jgi:hypothetical protein
MPYALGGLGCFNHWGLDIIFNCNRIFVCNIQSFGYRCVLKYGLCIDALVICVCGVGVLLIAFIRNFEWILPQQLTWIVLRYL